MLDLADILELIVNRLDERPLAEEGLLGTLISQFDLTESDWCENRSRPSGGGGGGRL
jgi:hypothetical protein